ncbi:MAG: hypothetical protein ACI97K_001111 [Glaciecola sp.]|jgi:hypothetical protein
MDFLVAIPRALAAAEDVIFLYSLLVEYFLLRAAQEPLML